MSEKYEVEIYSKDTLYVETITIDSSASDETSVQTITTSKIFERICFKLAKNKVKYDLLLEDLLKSIMELLMSDIGSISVKNHLIEHKHTEQHNLSDGLICVALSERRPGMIFTKSSKSNVNRNSVCGSVGHKSLNNMFGEACKENK